MTEWVLVLVMLRGGIDVEHVPGFEIRDECLAAGREIVDHIDDVTGNEATFLCVQRSVTQPSGR